jgi:BMFP domain-containing protein YqiC
MHQFGAKRRPPVPAGRRCPVPVLVFCHRLRYEARMARETIDQLARRLAESLPQSVKAVRNDLEQNFRSILDSGLARLDLVTREEFDVQEAVLARTRAKLEALEARLQALEAPPAARKTAARSTRKKKAATGTASKKKTARKASAKKKSTAKKKKKTARKT